MENILGVDPGRFVLAAGAVAIGLVLLAGILWFIRSRPSSPFIRGGKNRQPRLAVLDAAAIDTRRRLVLVRRDDVEHLVMIGGPTDIVIESRIVRPPQPTVTGAASDPARAPEQRPVPAAAQPVVAQRGATGQPPVSAMGQALYGEATETAARRPPQGPVQASTQTAAQQQRPSREEPQPARRPEPLPAVSVPVRQPVAVETPVRSPTLTPVPVSAQISPEDILDAARSRVLSSPSAEGRERVALQSSVGQEPAGKPQPKTAPATEFERVLDAEISGDLQRLTPDLRAKPEAGATRTPATPQRRDPVLGPVLGPPTAGARQEPSIEDEMNRMLGEMSAGRKP